MSDNRYTPDYESSTFSHALSSLIANYMEELHPLDLARACQRHANRLRQEADNASPRYTIELRDNVGPSVAVYDETGEEFLFHTRAKAFEFIEEKLEERA